MKHTGIMGIVAAKNEAHLKYVRRSTLFNLARFAPRDYHVVILMLHSIFPSIVVLIVVFGIILHGFCAQHFSCSATYGAKDIYASGTFNGFTSDLFQV